MSNEFCVGNEMVGIQVPSMIHRHHQPITVRWVAAAHQQPFLYTSALSGGSMVVVVVSQYPPPAATGGRERTKRSAV